ncbi:MAG: hypothetical protein K2W95_35205 [Candidatus Obscuribacterales bacterium]|nr:hypothetical protein [Candidatus Obscuribacterales bacterium]
MSWTLALPIAAGAAIAWLLWKHLPLLVLIPAIRKRHQKQYRIIMDPIAEYDRSWLTRRMYIRRFRLLPKRAPLDRSGMGHQWNWLYWNIQFCDGTTCPARGTCRLRGCCHRTQKS